MENKKRIMILGASILQLPAILKSKDMGHEVVSVDMDEKAIGFKYADKKIVLSTNDINGVLSAAKILDIDGIMTIASDMPMRTVATVAESLNLVGISIETAIKATNKARMRDALKKNEVPIPAYHEVSEFSDYIEAIATFKSKVVVKPIDSSGSRGIYLIEDPTNIEDVKYAFEYSIKYSKNSSLIVEEYMMGPEVSVESITYEGITRIISITDKLTTGSPRFVEMGHSQPTNLLPETVEKIINITKNTIEAIGIDYGPAHTEIIVTDEGPKVVEIGARMGGDNITTHLVPLSTGIDMVKDCINIALGEPPTLAPIMNLGSAIRYLKSPIGVIKEIKGLESAKKIQGIKEIYLSKSSGDLIEETINSSSRLGYIIAQGNSATHAVELCNRALSEIKIVIEDGSDRK